MDGSDGIRINSIRFEDVAAQQPLRWAAPIPSTSCDSNAYEHNWRRLQFVFPDLGDPRKFPGLPDALVGTDDWEVLERYCEHAVDLGQAYVLNGRIALTVRLDAPGAEEQIEAEFGSRDAALGFSVLFRQCYSNEEPASFNRVQGILRRANATASDPGVHDRDHSLRAWARAQGRLRGFSLMELCGEAVTGRPWSPDLPKPTSPELLISVFNYGSDLHWGRHRETLREWAKDPGLEAHHRMDFFESAASLAYLYVGFAALVAAAIDRPFG